MRFDFLSPELFDMLILANLAVGVLLIIWRFYLDMTRKPPTREQRNQEQNVPSYDFLSETDANPALTSEKQEKAK